jgi:hypothetical protein
MRYPPRLAHLATRAIVVAKLTPTYAAAHHIEEDEARERLDAALKGPLLERLLAAAWEALQGETKRLTEDGLLEKVAGALKNRPLRQGREAPPSVAWSAFMLAADLAANTASDAARKVLETEDGQRRIEQGIAEAGGFLAKELTRK